MSLASEVLKNFKIIFRSKTSLSLLVFGPLALIFVIGWTLSGSNLNDITIGIIDTQGSSNTFKKSFENFSKINYYNSEVVSSGVNDCIRDIKLSKVYLCIVFLESDSESEGELNAQNLVIYYDNSNRKISLILVEGIQRILGQASNSISLGVTKNIFNEIQTLVVFIKDKKNDINDFTSKAEQTKSLLIQRKEKLIDARNQFIPKYNQIKEIQSELNSVSTVFENNVNLLDIQIDSLNSQINNLVNDVNNLRNKINILGIIPGVNINDVSDVLLIFNNNLINFQNNLRTFDNKKSSFLNDYRNYKNEFNNLVAQIDLLKDLIDKEISFTERFIVEISSNIDELKSIGDRIDDDVDDLEKLTPNLAETITKPIDSKIRGLLNLKRVALIFPFFLPLILIFISLFFSNIVTLGEINSKAFVRSLTTPVNQISFTLGLVVTNFIVISFQIFVVLVISQISFGVDIISNFFPAFFVIFLLSLNFIFLGMSIAYFFNNQETSILLTTFTALVFFLFQGLLVPIEAMPFFAALIAKFNPLQVGEFLFRKLLLYKVPLSLLYQDLFVLIFYCLISLSILILSVRKNTRKI